MAIKKRILAGALVLFMAIIAVYGAKLMQAQETAEQVQVKEYDLDKISNAQADISRGINYIKNDLREIKRGIEDIKNIVKKL